MKLKDLKKELDKQYGFDIFSNTRERKYAYAKKVFCKIAYRFHTLAFIGEFIGYKHENVLYHKNSINNIYDEDKKIFDKVVLKYDLDLPLFNDNNKKKKTDILNDRELFDLIPENKIEEFKQTRLLPYLKMNGVAI